MRFQCYGCIQILRNVDFYTSNNRKLCLDCKENIKISKFDDDHILTKHYRLTQNDLGYSGDNFGLGDLKNWIPIFKDDNNFLLTDLQGKLAILHQNVDYYAGFWVLKENLTEFEKIVTEIEPVGYPEPDEPNGLEISLPLSMDMYLYLNGIERYYG